MTGPNNNRVIESIIGVLMVLVGCAIGVILAMRDQLTLPGLALVLVFVVPGAHLVSRSLTKELFAEARKTLLVWRGRSSEDV